MPGRQRERRRDWSGTVIKSTGSIRQVGDYRKLNSCIIPELFESTKNQDFSNALSGICNDASMEVWKYPQQWKYPIYLTLCECISTYQFTHNLFLKQPTVCTSFELIEFLYLNFESCNAAQAFQRLMSEILDDLPF
ncbi:hypothetical protein CEXT_64931 [Caerostris extrusa]|uniref:Uncharacterized protein n=1 Tax=Caerostris extrusa TaxID=172846 RepID=A0AAV4T1Z2_CAEEX|nr:hypothetical protein CEXT_64931 [Caerostris extrusa]